MNGSCKILLFDKTIHLVIIIFVIVYGISNSCTPQVSAWKAVQGSIVGGCYKTVLTVNPLVG